MCKFTEKISQDQYLKCLEYAKISVLVVQYLKIEYYNPNIGDFLGYSNEEIENADFLKNITVNNYSQLKDVCEKRIYENNINETPFEVKVKHKNGKVLTLRVISYGVYWNEQPASLVVFFDATNETSLLLDQLHYKYIFENASLAIDVCNLDGLIIDMNRKSELLWNIDRNDFINKLNFFDLERIKEDTVLTDQIKEAVSSRQIKNIPVYNTTNNSGESRWVSTQIYPVIAKDDIVDRFVVLNADLTERVKARLEKEQLYEDLLYKNHILESLTHISKVLLECTDPSNIQQVLQIIGETLNVSRAYIYESPPLLQNKYEWLDENTPHSNITIENYKALDLDNILKNKYSMIIENTETVSVKDMYIFKNTNSKSIIIHPIYLPNNELYGFIGVDTCNSYRAWKDCEISIIKNISNLIGSFIKKCYYEKRLDKFMKDQALILDNLDSYIWFFRNADTYGFINQKYYVEYIENKELKHTSKTFKDDCLLEDCHIVEESEMQKRTNVQVLQTNTPLVYRQWLTNKSGQKRLLSIKKIPVTDETRNYIICIADDITEQYNLEKKVLDSLRNTFEEKSAIIDNNLDQIKQTLDDSRELVNKHIVS